MGKQKYSQEIVDLVIKMRTEGKTIPEIQTATSMGRPSQQKLYKKRGIYLTEEQKDAAVVGARWKNHEPIVDGKKDCSVCRTNKPVEEFHKSKHRTTGFTSSCKACSKAKYQSNPEPKKAMVREYQKENVELIKASAKERYKKNVESYIAYAKKWAQKNPEKAREAARKYGKRNQKKKNAKTALYRAAKIKATPPWLTENDKLLMRAMYEECPPGFHVDHIVPLRSDDVCGLHVPWNLQLLPGVENMSKGNKIVLEHVSKPHKDEESKS